jgi:hypothetical protein
VVATSLVLGTVASWWLVPAYLVLMGWLLLPADDRAGGKAQVASPGNLAGQELRAMHAASGSPAAAYGAGLTETAAEPTGAEPGPAVAVRSAPAKRTRGGRGRSKAVKERTAPEPPPASWVRIGPGKFVRVEGPERVPAGSSGSLEPTAEDPPSWTADGAGSLAAEKPGAWDPGLDPIPEARPESERVPPESEPHEAPIEQEADEGTSSELREPGEDAPSSTDGLASPAWVQEPPAPSPGDSSPFPEAPADGAGAGRDGPTQDIDREHRSERSLAALPDGPDEPPARGSIDEAAGSDAASSLVAGAEEDWHGSEVPSDAGPTPSRPSGEASRCRADVSVHRPTRLRLAPTWPSGRTRRRPGRIVREARARGRPAPRARRPTRSRRRCRRGGRPTRNADPRAPPAPRAIRGPIRDSRPCRA